MRNTAPTTTKIVAMAIGAIHQVVIAVLVAERGLIAKQEIASLFMAIVHLMVQLVAVPWNAWETNGTNNARFPRSPNHSQNQLPHQLPHQNRNHSPHQLPHQNRNHSPHQRPRQALLES